MNKRFKISVLTVIVNLCLILSLFSCQFLTKKTHFVDNEYSIVALEEEELYYRYPLGNYVGIPAFDYLMDSNGVELSRYAGELYYNPVILAARGLNFFDRFINIPDSLYYDHAIKHRDALIALMDEDGYFEYRMDYHHYDINYESPWYSGMGQGLGLSLFSFLANFAGDSISAELAHKIYKTLDPFSELSSEVVFKDSLNYAWIEEYPGYPLDHTLNGFMFAIIGLNDYYQLINQDDNVAEVISIYLTTLNKYMTDYRNHGNISYYCLRHKVLSATYHPIHIRQFRYFANLCTDSSFAALADSLDVDY